MNEDGMILIDHYLNTPMKGYNTLVMKKEHWDSLKLELELLKNTLKGIEKTIEITDLFIDNGDVEIIKNTIKYISIMLGEVKL